MLPEAKKTGLDKLKAQGESHSNNNQKKKWGIYIIFITLLIQQGSKSHYNNEKHPYFKLYFTKYFQVTLKFKLLN